MDRPSLCAGRHAGPWKTLHRASAAPLQPGDRILLKRGDAWDEELRPRGNGTPKNPIVIGAYGTGGKPLIDRKDDRKDLFGIHLADQEGFKIEGIEFSRCMTGIYAEFAAGAPSRKFIWIEDCYFHDSKLYGHYENYPKRKIGLGICFFTFERGKRIVLSDITIKDCVFRRLASGVWTNNPDNFNKNASFVYNFANMTFDGCLFEEGYQWPLGLRGIDGGVVRNCVTHDIGRGFRSFNGVAGAMIFRCKNWLFEDSQWGFIDIGLGSGDGEAFDFEGNCDHMSMRNCLFHDTDGPGFLLCCYASDGNPNRDVRIENCVFNGKAKRPIRLPRCEIVNTTDWNETTWKGCRFYLSRGEVLMRTMDPEKDKRALFVDCTLKDLSAACGTSRLPAKSTNSSTSRSALVELDFGKPVALNEFRIAEAPGSSIERYTVQCWDDKQSTWVGCFNGRAIGYDFIAPIVSRTTSKARLIVLRTAKGSPAISGFDAYNDTTGDVFNIPRGGTPPMRVGR